MEWLKKLLGDELFATVATKLGDTKLLLDDGSYVPKAQLDEATAQLGGYKTQVEASDSKLKDLQEQLKKMPDSEALQKQVAELQEGKTAAETKANDILLSSAIKLEAVKSKAHNPDDVLVFIDRSKLKLNGDKVEGIDDVMKGIKESKAYLFMPEGQTGGGANPKGGGGTGPTDAEKAAGEFKAALG